LEPSEKKLGVGFNMEDVVVARTYRLFEVPYARGPTTGAVMRVSDHARETWAILIQRLLEISSTILDLS
jgi:hypothetical protein